MSTPTVSENPHLSLLIWEQFDRSADLYLIPQDEAAKYEKVLKACHGKFINGDDEPALDTLWALVCPEKYGADAVPVGKKKHAHRWEKFKIDASRPIAVAPIRSVYISGQIP
jgi:hypothetical protein